MAPKITNLTDGIAKRLWSGEVKERDYTTGGNLAESYNSYQKTYPIQKEDGVRRGTTPEHIDSPQAGKPRPFDPFTLRELADTETVQAAIDTVIKDMRSIPWQISPVDDDADPSSGVITEAERAMADLNPNPESLEDINEMFLRDAMETGNLFGVINPQMDGRRAEVVPLDPNTVTVDWDKHRILNSFYQYPNVAGSRFGEPDPLEPDEVLWGVANPETGRAGFYGHSPVEKLQMIINVMGGLVEKEVKELEEGMPSGMITLLGDSWDDDDYEHFEEYWQNEVKGQQHKVPYSRGEAEFVPFNMSYKELQVLDRQQWYAKLVGAVFNVPVSESGLQVGETNRATDVSIRQKYKQNGLRPWLDLLETVWTQQYLHKYWSENIQFEFDPGLDILERKELATIHGKRLRQGSLTVNEVREELGKDPVPWGDEPFDRKQYARANTGGAAGSLLGGDGDGPDSGGGGEPTPQEEAQEAQEEGTQQDPGDTDFKNTQGQTHGTWVSKGQEVICKEALRSTDSPHQFSFQPKEIKALKKDLEDTFEEYIEGVRKQVKGNQQLLRSDGGVSKSSVEFMQIIEEQIGLDFAEDVAQVLTEHKGQKILDGEQDIMTELEQAGLSVEDIDLEQTRQRVISRIKNRTLKVTKPISNRLEDQLRDTLVEGWQEGQSITDIERSIEEVTDKWQGTDAERLARDQLGRASKEGRMEYAKETEDQVGGWEKTWLATGDARTRDSHAEMDGVTVARSEPFLVDYSYDNGPSEVEEEYPGESVYGIQCRCDYALSPKGQVEKVRKWAEDPTDRMQELEEEHGKDIGTLLLSKELNPEISRSAAADELGISKPTLYDWGEQAGLIET